MNESFKTVIPAKYFPVSEKPLTMKSGLNDFGTDFGNGEIDSLYFQKDSQASLYRRVKKEVETGRHWATCNGDRHKELHSKVLAWIIEKQQEELGIIPQEKHLEALNSLENLDRVYNELSLNVQEDMALIENEPSSLIMGNISMPSFWDPKRIKNADFWQIHEPVPSFPKNERISKNLGSLIATKGPYVRFVWTVANDDRLDHHPAKGRTEWKETQNLWFRTERQVTVPFDGLGALFLIRTYLYAFEGLSKGECRTLSLALKNMPEELARYKGLWEGRDVIANKLFLQT